MQLTRLLHCRYLHSYAGSECVRIRLVSSEAIIMRWTVLDGRFNGNDNIECAGSGTALRLEHNAISTGTDDNHRVHGHDVEFDILGTIQ